MLPVLNAARIELVVGVPEILLSAAWTFITVAKPAAEIESISVPGAPHFFIAAWNSWACWLVPVGRMNGEAMYTHALGLRRPPPMITGGGAPHGSMPISLPL